MARSVAALLALRPARLPQGAVGRFNAFETSTEAAALGGFLRTKVAGQSFRVDIAAINTLGTAYATDSLSGIRVDLLDASDDSGAMDAAGCRSTWLSVETLSSAFSLSPSDRGRKTFSGTANTVLRQARLRMSSSGSSGSLTGCSNDAFAVRPAAFIDVVASDANAESPGTARVLSNDNPSSGVVHRAGRPFTLRARAVDANGLTAQGYDGTAQIVSTCVQPDGCVTGTLTGTLTARTGLVAGTLTYEEAGVVSLSLSDASFSSIDSSDSGSTSAERTISQATPTTVGRFVADRYDIQIAAPTLRPGCEAANVTFAGQPFGFTSPPFATASAVSASGQVLLNARPRFDASMVTIEARSSSAPLTLQGSIGDIALTHSSLTAITVGRATFNFERIGTPLRPFFPAFSLRVLVEDSTERNDGSPIVIAGQRSIGFGFPSDHAVHYAALSLRPGYGDARQDLVVSMELQSFNGIGWVPLPAAAACVGLAARHFSYSGAIGSLATNGAFNCASSVAEILPSGGRWSIRLRRPALINGPVEGAMNLHLNTLPTTSGQVCSAGVATSASSTLSMPWLARPDGTNPSARVQWGRSKGEFIHVRERF
jgi:hypothetical protein